jgi:hypothetical protein
MLFKKKDFRFKIQSAERKSEMESRIVKQSLTAGKGTTYDVDENYHTNSRRRQSHYDYNDSGCFPWD